MSRREIMPRLPIVFGLQEAEAAAAIGIGATKFRELVDAGRMPKPRLLDHRLVYDVDELRAAFKAMPHEGEQAAGSTWVDVA
jgi:hypothetical protein